MLNETSYYSTQIAQVICNLQNIRDFKRFSLKSQLVTYPFRSILFFFSVIMISSGFLLRIFERTLSKNDFGYIWNGFYSIGITETTVGYGDVIAGSHIGRLIVVFASIYGIFSVSYIVWAVQSTLGFSKEEYGFYERVISKKDYNYKLKPISIKLIQK